MGYYEGCQTLMQDNEEGPDSPHMCLSVLDTGKQVVACTMFCFEWKYTIYETYME